MSFQTEARRRLLPHAVVFLVWPIVSILFATILLTEHPIASDAPVRGLIVGCVICALRMIPEWLIVGLCGFLLSVLSFAGLAAALRRRSQGRPRPALVVEPFLLALAATSGVVLEYPAVLRHPFLTLLRGLPVAGATAVLLATTCLFALALGWQFGGAAGGGLATISAGVLVFLFWQLSLSPPIDARKDAPPRQSVILGIDSVAQSDEVSDLRTSVRRLDGTWYERPVPPGLVTNSVLTAILMDRPVHDTGVFRVFQIADWKNAPFNVVKRARAAGCQTYAYFTTRITFQAGTEAGFDVDRSGPRGWHHLATLFLKDGSIFLPIALARLREIPGAFTPANQSGTFSYDLRREIHSILTARTGSGCSFVVGHLGYMHETAFPPFSKLTAAERRAVRAARVETVRDLTLAWQPPLETSDPLGIEGWKVAYVQKLVVEEIERTRFLSPEKGNRLVIFSDHGNRRELTEKNFGEPRYHRVLFATFGVPSRDPREPISLLDIPDLLGFAGAVRMKRADPVVEYTNSTPEEWNRLKRSAKLLSNGRVVLDPAIVRAIGQRLQGFRPYAPGGYFPTPLRRPPV